MKKNTLRPYGLSVQRIVQHDNGCTRWYILTKTKQGNHVIKLPRTNISLGCNRHHQEDFTFFGVGIPRNLYLSLCILCVGGWGVDSTNFSNWGMWELPCWMVLIKRRGYTPQVGSWNSRRQNFQQDPVTLGIHRTEKNVWLHTPKHQLRIWRLMPRVLAIHFLRVFDDWDLQKLPGLSF